MSFEGTLRDRQPAGFHLIETMRWEPGAGFLRRDRHLARLAHSASELGFRLDPEAVEDRLSSIEAETAQRVRLALYRDGRCEILTQPFAPLPPDTVWRVGIAATRLDENDPLLRHKTSRRAVFEAARAEFADAVDEVILLNGRDELCEGGFTSLFLDMGGGLLSTPPLSAGLLAGVLRGELLDQNRAKEAPLRLADLEAAKAIHVGNSLRGLIRCRIV
ncbi:aminotransferase class IV family protein [Aquamicrobium sp. LC103]|uniref:aminotransferase class IV family protein n=1 Tax=Aquamicrobium sp. LC103 TaxID=1120658 RepID=UPI00063E96C1|nr:aminotransferase class IV family protein [Aquamicrobium sp. LC103]TKT77530.1 hypothetical protein XW59_013765 [Aquamicrobium sp. LC103]